MRISMLCKMSYHFGDSGTSTSHRMLLLWFMEGAVRCCQSSQRCYQHLAWRKLAPLIYPYVKIKIDEHSGSKLKRSELYTAVESYLSSSCSLKASKLKVELGKDGQNLMLSMDDHEEITDEYKGVMFLWRSISTTFNLPSHHFRSEPQERRSYVLTFHKSQRDLVLSGYLRHVTKEGKEVRVRNRQRKLYTNIPKYDSFKLWSHVAFDSSATFDTLAMDSRKKKEIIDDLDKFHVSKDFYAKMGKAWKRGYLLYGPPGTGKSTLIAAIANYLDYDIYDLELTAVSTNADLRKLLIETTSRSIILIEDIDCSLELSGKRKKKKKVDRDLSEVEEKDENSKVTLSGLLNFIDGIWSSSVGERLVVLTTNHVEKLDPGLTRRGRMDKHIEMSYCSFEAFKVLAMNYLDVSDHELFEEIESLIKDVRITPADVAENLMPKSVTEDAESCLLSLVQTLKSAKEAGLQVVDCWNESSC